MTLTLPGLILLKSGRWCRIESRRFDHHLVKPIDPYELARLLVGQRADAGVETQA